MKKWHHFLGKAKLPGTLHQNTWRDLWRHFVAVLLRRPPENEISIEMWARGASEVGTAAEVDGKPAPTETYVDGVLVNSEAA